MGGLKAIIPLSSLAHLSASSVLMATLISALTLNRASACNSAHSIALCFHVGCLLFMQMVEMFYSSGILSCRITVVCYYFFELSAFSWLQIICINLAQSSRESCTPRRSLSNVIMSLILAICGPISFVIVSESLLLCPRLVTTSQLLYDAKTCYLDISRRNSNSFDLTEYVVVLRGIIILITFLFAVYIYVKARFHKKYVILCQEDANSPGHEFREEAMWYLLLMIAVGLTELGSDLGAVYFSKLYFKHDADMPLPLFHEGQDQDINLITTMERVLLVFIHVECYFEILSISVGLSRALLAFVLL